MTELRRRAVVEGRTYGSFEIWPSAGEIAVNIADARRLMDRVGLMAARDLDRAFRQVAADIRAAGVPQDDNNAI